MSGRWWRVSLWLVLIVGCILFIGSLTLFVSGVGQTADWVLVVLGAFLILGGARALKRNRRA
jgi:hypothetical protein